MLISNDRNKIHTYVEYLKREIAMVARTLGDRDRFEVAQMHWGGGSPTHLLPDEINEVGSFLRELFRFASDAEVSIEVDPRGFTEDHAKALRQQGFNRASVGVQDFFPDTQWAVNRIQPYELTADVIALLRRYGVASVNIDLIYGLPYQTIGTFKGTMDQVLTLKPDRLAIYNFAYVPWVKPHQKLIQIDTLPQSDKKVALHFSTIERITEAGYDYIGMDHYAKPDDELAIARRDGTLQRNFQGYSTKAGMRMIGFGISAIGKIHSKAETNYIQNVKGLDAYYAAIDAGELPVDKGYTMTEDDLLREFIISQLMCQMVIDVKQVENRFNISFEKYFAESLEKLKPMILDNLVKLTTVGSQLCEVRVTNVGKLFLRNIAMTFDAYLPASNARSQMEQSVIDKPIYSRTL